VSERERERGRDRETGRERQRDRETGRERERERPLFLLEKTFLPMKLQLIVPTSHGIDFAVNSFE